jgi:hypothetical protein
MIDHKQALHVRWMYLGTLSKLLVADVVHGCSLHQQGIATSAQKGGSKQASDDHCTIPEGCRGLRVRILHEGVILRHLVGVQAVNRLREMVLVLLVLLLISDGTHVEGLSHWTKALLIATQGRDDGELQRVEDSLPHSGAP